MISNTLYAKYIKEREDADIIENDHGFLTYKILNKEMIIINLYIDQNSRKSGYCRDLVAKLEEKAIAAMCDIMTGNIHIVDPGANITMQAALMLGFKIGSANQNTILIYKNISGGLENG